MPELAQDYAAMREDGLLGSGRPDYDAVMEACGTIQDLVNQPC